MDLRVLLTLLLSLAADAATSPPTFVSAPYSFSVRENLDAGAAVGTVEARDAAGRKLRYSVSSITAADRRPAFSIDPGSGAISTTQLLDREVLAMYLLLARAEPEGGSDSATATVTVTVVDANDHTPVCEEVYNISRVEGLLGSDRSPRLLTTVRAKDADAGANREVRYRLAEPLRDAEFAVDSVTGEVRTVAKEFDREKTAHYRVPVLAVDQAPVVADRRTATCQVNVFIVDKNDNVPQFSAASYSATLREDRTAKDGPFLRVRATDADAGSNGRITYSIYAGDSRGEFILDPESGELSVRSTLDYEKQQKYTLKVQASDGGTAMSHTNRTEVHITLLDLNDVTPHFSRTVYAAPVLESVAPGHLVLTVKAEDEDSGANGSVTYSLLPAGLPFAVDGNGRISTTQRLDREAKDEYQFTVEARDGGSPPRSASARVTVTLVDENDNTPAFRRARYVAVVEENAKVGSRVLEVEAIDPDVGVNGALRYGIASGNGDGLFRVESNLNKGLVLLAMSAEGRLGLQSLVLSVTDGGKPALSSTAEAAITITPANRHPPVFSKPSYRVPVAENFPIGRPFFQLHASDADGASSGPVGQVWYSLGDWKDVFAVDERSGNLSLRRHLDRETRAAYTFSVTARDGATPPRSAVAAVQVVVGDVNDHRPKFAASLVVAEVPEDAEVNDLVKQMKASDEDEGANGRVRFHMSGGEGHFKINPDDGKVRVASPLDRETRSSYDLVVTATDGGATPQTSTATMRVSILDVNDNKPVWRESKLEMTVAENSLPNTPVGKLQAFDPDEGKNAAITYRLMPRTGPGSLKPTPANYFVTSPAPNNSAVVHTTRFTVLDYEKGPRVFYLTVQAHSGHLFSSIPLVIRVTDANDNPPILHDFVVQLDNYDGQFPVGPIGRVPATDPDVTSRLRFRLVKGADLRVLNVSADTGQIWLNGRLNSDVDINVTLTVEVSDSVHTVTAKLFLRTRYVSAAAVGASVTVRVVGDTSTVAERLDAFAAAVAALFGEPARSFLLLSVDAAAAPGEPTCALTFAVRRWSAARPHLPSFLNASSVREAVHLNSRPLARAGLPVRPRGDDALCLLEPCANFQRCRERNVFRNASGFEPLSPRFLLRPIRVRPTASCECPRGFAGRRDAYSCDAEVNMCFSSPCSNGAACRPREGGFVCECGETLAGDRCQYRRQGGPKIDAPYPQHVCRPPSKFVPLIRGGFQCRDCPAVEPRGTEPQTTPLCQLRARHFSGVNASHLALPPLHQRSHFSLRLRFATVAASGGVLLYAGRYSGRDDVVSLRVTPAALLAHISLGNASAATSLSLPPCAGCRFDDGRWHRVQLLFRNYSLTLTRDDCDPGLAESVGCAASRRIELPKRCGEPTESCFRFLDVATPLYLGGRPSNSSDGRAFQGCIADVEVDGRLVDLRADVVYQEGTQEGCAPKRGFCNNSCRNGGKCVEKWNGAHCVCPDRYGGADCSIVIPSSDFFSLRQPEAITPSSPAAEVLFDYSAPPELQLPRLIALDFRTRDSESNVTLFHLHTLFMDSSLTLLAGGNRLVYTYSRGDVVAECDGRVQVSDGEWHRAELRWNAATSATNPATVTLDYGLCSSKLPASGGRTFNPPAFAATKPPRAQARFGRGLTGCLRHIVVAWPNNSTAPVRPDPVLQGNATRGCAAALPPGAADGCASCPAAADRAECVEAWRQRRCRCRPGHVTATCQPVCGSRWDPCRPGGRCEMDSSSARGYRCQCGAGRSGPLCEERQMTECADTWWGAPLCGPCNCRVDQGFDSRCNNTTGACRCRANHFSAPGPTPRCLPCPCYPLGSAAAECSATGVCKCKQGVSGSRCDRCEDAFAEITGLGCQVQYTDCPQAFADDILWRRTPLGEVARQTCPAGSVGRASRSCSRVDGWGVADTANCTSSRLAALDRDVSLLEAGRLAASQHLIRKLARDLNASLANRSTLYAGDLRLGARVVRQVVLFESARRGLDLSHTQDQRFLPDLMAGVSALLRRQTVPRWRLLAKLGAPVSAASLVSWMARYTAQLAGETLRTRVHFSSEQLELRVATHPLPTNLSAPLTLRAGSGSWNVSVALSGPGGLASGSRDANLSGSGLSVGALLFRNLTGLLDASEAERDEFEPGPPQVAAPVLALEAPQLDANATDVALQFSVPARDGLLELRCVFWDRSQWSTEGCLTLNRTSSPDGYVTCLCSHLSTFTVLGRQPPLRVRRRPVDVPLAVYLLCSAAIIFLLPTLVMLGLVLRTGYNCLTIHFHHGASAWIALLLYISTLRVLEAKALCRLAGVLVHYFALSSMAWLMVDWLHLYRRLTEVRNVDVGAMPFYLLLGYALPGIGVSLAVALRAEEFGGTGPLCWVPLTSPTAVSFLLPLGAAVAAQAVLLVLVGVRLWRMGFLHLPQRQHTEEREMERISSSLQAKDRPRKAVVASSPMPSSLRYNRPDLVRSITRADSRRSSSASQLAPSPSRCCGDADRLLSRLDAPGEGRGWALFHFVALALLSPLAWLTWSGLYIGAAAAPPNEALWGAGAACALLLCLVAAALHGPGHARVLSSLRVLHRHGGALPKEMRATALGASSSRYAPNPALEAEFGKLAATGSGPAGASTSSTTTTSGGATVVPGVYLAPTTASSGLASTGYTNAALAASLEEDDSEEDEEDGTVTSGDQLASSHSSDDDEDEEDVEMGPKWRLPDPAAARGRATATPSVHSSSQPTTTTDETVYGSTARLIRPGASGEPAAARGHAVYDNPALVLSARDLASLGTAWSSLPESAASSPPLVGELPELTEDDGEETAV